MIEVLHGGALTTVQDLGRFGFGGLGVSPGGAADALALRLANLLAGNDAGAAGLEMTLQGARLRFAAAATIALAGADFSARLDGAPVEMARALAVSAGAVLSFAGGRRGARTYLAIAGGVEVAPVLGSASTDLRAGFGGFAGRALRAGDALRLGDRRGTPRRLAESGRARLLARRSTLRVRPGTHAEAFSEHTASRLAGADFTVCDDSDRMGVRLEGERLALRAPLELLSEGVAPGAVQVPPGGAPIVLGVDHPSTGGYPQIASVITADLPSLAQLRPRDTVRFAWVSAAEARAALAEQEDLLATIGVRS